MSNVRKLSDYRPSLEVVERKVAQLEDGFLRLANELLDATMCSGLPETELCVVMAVWRKTYGFSKKMDWISNEQLEGMIGKHLTHCSTAKTSLVRKKVLIQEGRKVGMNTNISEWETKNNGFCKTLAKPAKKTLAEVANGPSQKLLTTKDNIQKTKDNTPLTPQGARESLAQECLDYYNELTSSRCSATACFEKALSTVKSKGVCYTVDEVKLVVQWAVSVWNHKPSINNVCRMTRFDGYLSDALKWSEGSDRNPVSCPHETLISLWNDKFPERAVEHHEWNKSRPAYRGLERIWNAKTNQGVWREKKHIETIFNLIRSSTLVDGLHEKYWLTLDWILDSRNWAKVYEQVRREYKLNRQGGQS
ncbi:replication protein [Erwinia aphidicola]|nr:replication protein [Erwinia aphidicola]